MNKAPVSRHTEATMSSRGLARGFTLIEMMIVVAIIGILAAIAIPAYNDYILRGKLVDATNMLSAFQANMERYYQDNRTYAAVGTIVPPCDASTSITSRQNSSGTFTLTCTGTGAPTTTQYMLTVTGTGAVNNFVYTINQRGAQQTLGLGAGWTATLPATCWIVKRGQTC